MRRTVLPALAAALALTCIPAPALADGAALQLSKSEGLVEGDEITVKGTGFKPGLQQIAVGLCIEGYTNGLKHCDLDGGATFVNADKNGDLPPVTLTVSPKFLEFDCLARQCVVGVGPLPGSAPDAVRKANSVITRLGFEGATFSAAPTQSAAPAAAEDADPDGVGGPSTLLWALTAGSVVLVTVLAARRQSLRRIT